MAKNPVESLLWHMKLELNQCVAAGLYDMTGRPLANVDSLLHEKERVAMGRVVVSVLKRAQKLFGKRVGLSQGPAKLVIETQEHAVFYNTIDKAVLVLVLRKPVECPGTVFEVMRKWSSSLKHGLKKQVSILQMPLKDRASHPGFKQDQVLGF